MFRTLFGRKSEPEAPPSTEGRLVYAIGDIHGRLDLLKPLLHDIARDALAARPAAQPMLIFLGDYIDRGPQSREVVDLVLAMQADGAFEVAPLKGNHEDALVKFLEQPEFASTWMEYGGGPTLASYGVQPAPQHSDPAGWERVRDQLDEVLPDAHRRFYLGLELMRIIGDYAFVHAGVRPGVALADQAEPDLLWIRQDFLQHRGRFEKVIVHGHSASEAPQLTNQRLGLDTGAYATGVLTAVRLCGEDQRLLQAQISKRTS